ncbi:MAG: acylphosphatase [Chloroflexota bacterium]
MSGQLRLHLIVRGHVQGVGFRWFVVRAAAGLDLAGWVMNRSDRAVELVAEGDAERLEELLAVVREGPPSSVVEDVEVIRSPASGGLGSFHIRSGAHPGD